MDRENPRDTPPENTLGRREFIGTTAVAASWWALTAKTDALAQVQARTNLLSGGNPTSQDYHYDEGP